MPAIHIRDLDDALIDALKTRAARHRRSLQGEVKSILDEAVRPIRRGARHRRIKLRLNRVRVGAQTSFSREDIYGDDGR